MITTFLIGTLLGFGVGWYLCLRLYDKHLKVANEQRKQLALRVSESGALLLACAKALDQASANKEVLDNIAKFTVHRFVN